MLVALSIFSVALAAFCVWLTVRIVNRRERWTKWTLAAVIGIPVLYVLGVGPVLWLANNSSVMPDWCASGIRKAYVPLIRVMLDGPWWIQRPLTWWFLKWQ